MMISSCGGKSDLYKGAFLLYWGREVSLLYICGGSERVAECGVYVGRSSVSPRFRGSSPQSGPAWPCIGSISPGAATASTAVHPAAWISGSPPAAHCAKRSRALTLASANTQTRRAPWACSSERPVPAHASPRTDPGPWISSTTG